jgi:molybdopterin-guanine dinucleotide biosynthesis protein
MLLQALAPLLVQGAGASSAVTVEREGLFVAGQHFDALQLAVQVFSRAKQDIVIIDAYIDHRLLQLLAMKHEAVSCAEENVLLGHLVIGSSDMLVELLDRLNFRYGFQESRFIGQDCSRTRQKRIELRNQDGDS